MFRQWGSFLSSYWYIILASWLTVFVALRFTAPSFDDVARGGEFVFLPASMPSRLGEALRDRAFPAKRTASSMVVIVTREEQDGLTDDDKSFITDKLVPNLEQIRDRINRDQNKAKHAEGSNATNLIGDIHSFDETGIGELLASADGKASLVMVELASDFQDARNWKPIEEVENALNTLRVGSSIPKGLELTLTGDAVLGRDFSQAEAASARHIGPLTIFLVIVLLVAIYRAPLLAFVPLLTLFVAVDVSLNLLTTLAKAGYVPLFRGLREYTTVITYGPGIDYCLFLIARYKENLESREGSELALRDAIGQVGSAILASAATVICGIGMLILAQFGKFHEAGIGISISLVITLIATLSLTPAMLFMTGHWVFWPKPGVTDGKLNEATTKESAAVVQTNMFQPIWNSMGAVIERHPVMLLVATIGIMVPFRAVGVFAHGNVNYGLLESLPRTAISTTGARILEKHFPAGISGPVQILVQNDSLDFREDEGRDVINDVVKKLMQRHDELSIADIRSVADPLGTQVKNLNPEAEQSYLSKLVERKSFKRQGVARYVSETDGMAGHVTELEIVLTTNPFDLASVENLDRLSAAIKDSLPADQASKTSLSIIGPTASVRDVNHISQLDQRRIYFLVAASVLAILVILLRSITLSIYLLFTVLLSFLATLGVTWLVFYGISPGHFVGLDWTVPLFLFVVLIAVGEDYNIFLVTRIHEEQVEYGPTKGIRIALSQTGGIITSCGFIMAGTFASLLAGSLTRMQQLGFALAFGVLLDTLVVRPILVPAFLMLPAYIRMHKRSERVAYSSSEGRGAPPVASS